METMILISLNKDELQEIIRGVIREEFNHKKEKELLNFKEVCELLNVSPSTLNKFKSGNKIPFKRLGKRIFFDRQEVLGALKDSNYSKLKQIQC